MMGWPEETRLAAMSIRAHGEPLSRKALTRADRKATLRAAVRMTSAEIADLMRTIGEDAVERVAAHRLAEPECRIRKARA